MMETKQTNERNKSKNSPSPWKQSRGKWILSIRYYSPSSEICPRTLITTNFTDCLRTTSVFMQYLANCPGNMATTCQAENSRSFNYRSLCLWKRWFYFLTTNRRENSDRPMTYDMTDRPRAYTTRHERPQTAVRMTYTSDERRWENLRNWCTGRRER